MPTKRTPIRRVARRRIDAEALRLWKLIREINPADRKEYEPLGRHREYIGLNCQLCTRLGIWWGWMIFPAEVDRPEPRGYMQHNPPQAEVWQRAYRWRCLLMEAEGGP